jgi:ubiquitin carboxyl-terminal hydrolase 5/13
MALEVIRSSLRSLHIPKKSDKVYRKQSILNFDSPASRSGLFINLFTFEGYDEAHVDFDRSRTGCNLYLHLKQVLKEKKTDEPVESNASSITTFGLGVAGGFQPNDKSKEYEEIVTLLVYLPDSTVVKFHHPSETNSNDMPSLIPLIIDGILTQIDVKTEQSSLAWQDEAKESKYAKNLVQIQSNPPIRISPNSKDWKCQGDHCDKVENLWMNLSDGYIGCGRKNFDGSGGNNHALQHFLDTNSQFPLSVKLGTITPTISGCTGDVYSYAKEEDDLVLDPYLQTHLQFFNIQIDSLQKTEKLMSEINIELNAMYDFSRIVENNQALESVSKKGFIGLENIGNSCYMASIYQILSSIPEVQSFYGKEMLESSILPNASKTSDLPNDLLVQFCKLNTYLNSNEYSKTSENEFGYLNPFMMKAILGRSNAEFQSSKQQDVVEFFQAFLAEFDKLYRTKMNQYHISTDKCLPLSSLFQFQVENKLKVLKSGKVKYTKSAERVLTFSIPLEEATEVELEEPSAGEPSVDGPTEKRPRHDKVSRKLVSFDACLRKWASPSSVEYRNGEATLTNRVATFPPYLLIQLSRYTTSSNWTPVKIEALVEMPTSFAFNTDKTVAKGLQLGEELLQEEEVAGGRSNDIPASSSVVPDETLVNTLVEFGFPRQDCERAASAVSNSNVEEAMEWLLNATPSSNEAAASSVVTDDRSTNILDQGMIQLLCDMGFNEERAKHALRQTDGNIERATDWLFSHMNDNLEEAQGASANHEAESNITPPSLDLAPEQTQGHYDLVGFVSHIGSSTSSGHYVAHIRKLDDGTIPADGTSGQWYLFNDEKVVKSKSMSMPFGFGYFYLYRRRD